MANKTIVRQYSGSPDLFDSSGKYLSGKDVEAMGGFGAIQIEKQSGLRPGVTTEADFAKVAGTNLPSINTQQVPKQAPQVSLPQPTASRVQEDYITPLANQVQKDRQRLEAEQKRQLDENRVKQEATQKKMDELRAQTTNTLEEDVKPLMEPFRAELETTERERLSIDENFQKNQELTNELENLLTEGNQIIQEMKGVTGLAGIRNPRINKAIEDISARAGVIEAVMSARNGQINQAYTMIDRSVSAITADRNDQLNYYNTLIELYESERDEEGNRLLNLEKGELDIIKQQTGLIEQDLQRSQEYADNIKKMMIDPNTAQFMAQAGVKLTDSPEQVNKKMSDYSYTQEVRGLHDQMQSQGATWIPTPDDLAGIPQDQIVKATDSRGQVHQYRVQPELLSVAEAKSLGVPFGTTKEQAFGITPTSGGNGGGSVGTIGGVNVSNSTLNVMEGISSIEDLTPTEAEKTRTELRNLGFYSDQVPEWFRKQVEEGDAPVNYLPEVLQEIWNDERQSILSEGSGSKDVPASVLGKIRALKEGNASREDIESYVSLQGYEVNAPNVQDELENYEAGNTGGSWWKSVLGFFNS